MMPSRRPPSRVPPHQALHVSREAPSYRGPTTRHLYPQPPLRPGLSLTTGRVPTLSGRPVTAPRRSFHTNVIEHCLEGLKHATTGGMRSLSFSLAEHMGYSRAIDQSKILNSIRGRIGNQQEFTQFVTSKVFAEFAPFIDPMFQKTFKDNLKNLEFEDAHALFQKFSELSEKYLALESDAHRTGYQAGQSRGKAAQKWKTDMDIDLAKLDSKMGALIHDCLLRVAIATGKKKAQEDKKAGRVIVLEEIKTGKKRAQAKKEKKTTLGVKTTLEKKGKKTTSGMTITADQLKVIDELQRDYSIKLSQLEALDRNSEPRNAKKLEKECKELLDELLKILHVKPKDLLKLALKFEQSHKQEGAEKLDPNKYSSTERRILIGSAANLTNYLIEFVLATVLGMVILNALDQDKNVEEQKRGLFVTQMQQACEDNMMKLRDLESRLEHLPDTNPFKQKFVPHIAELRELIDEQMQAIREYKNLSANQLGRTNVLNDMVREKINTYTGLHAWLKKSSENVHNHGRTVQARSEIITEKMKVVRLEYKNAKISLKGQVLKMRCMQEIQGLEKLKLNSKQSKDLQAFQERLDKMKGHNLDELDSIKHGLLRLAADVQHTPTIQAPRPKPKTARKPS